MKTTSSSAFLEIPGPDAVDSVDRGGGGGGGGGRGGTGLKM